MSNVLSEEQKQQIIALGRLGWSLRRIQRGAGVRRETAAAYLRAAGIEPRPPGRWGRQAPGRGPTASPCEPCREVIEIGLGQGRNAKAIWQDLVDDHGFRGAYQSVQRFVGKLRGSGPMVRDPASGRHCRTRMFVLTLGYSRKSVRLLTFHFSTRIWAELHERAFRRIGGLTKVVVLDNLGEGVLAPDIYDPALNPLYRDMLTHYGVVALPCRVGDPDRKGKVEAGVGHAKKTPLKGLRFESLEEAQAYLDRWEERWADTRIHGTTKRQVAAMFAEERPALLPLPLEPFRYYQFGERTVHLDGCVEIEAAYYGAPPGWIGRRVQVQWDDRHVRLLDPKTGQLLREHLRQQRGGHRIKDEDRPSRTPLGTEQLLHRAERAGRHIGALCQGMHRLQGVPAVRRIRFVRRYLERRPHSPLSLRQVDPLIRQLTLYRDFIADKTKEENEP
jgi:transposase